MNRGFDLDIKKRRRMKKKNYKRHPLWEKWKVWIYIFLPLSLISLIGIVISFALLMGADNGHNEMFGYMLLSTPFVFIIAVIFMSLRISIKQRGSDQAERQNSTLFLEETGIVSAFSLFKNDFKSRHVVEIPFDKIEKLIYNKRHERLMIIGKGYLTVYDDYERGIIYVNQTNKNITGKKHEIESKIPTNSKALGVNSHMVIYDIFDDFKTFMQIVSERSNVEIQTLNVPEAIDQPKYNAKNIYDSIK